MNNHTHHIVVSRSRGIAAILARCNFKPKTESAGLLSATGRVLAHDLRAKNTLPNMLCAAMDGIGVHFDAFSDGIPDTHSWKQGVDFDFCNTGIGIKGDYDTVIMIEKTKFDPKTGALTILEAPRHRGEKTTAIGSSMKKGDLLIEAGTKLEPAHLGLAAQAGYSRLELIAKPRVAFIPSGNELVCPGGKVPPGKSVDCNSYVLASKFALWGAVPILNEICPDKHDVIKNAILKQTKQADIVVINAGSSKGTDDLSMEILEEIGEVLNHEFLQAPGKHSGYAIVNETPVVGIAGPPIGAEYCADFFVKPLIDAFLGQKAGRHTIWAVLDEDVACSPRSFTLVERVSLHRTEAGQLFAHPLSRGARPVLKMAAAADGFLLLDKDCNGYKAGDKVVIELRYPYTVPAI